jgi:hypothetical protein
MPAVFSSTGALSETRRKVEEAPFSMPQGFRVVEFIGNVEAFTAIMEVFGVIALFAAF